jgi:hypothetical protein
LHRRATSPTSNFRKKNEPPTPSIPFSSVTEPSKSTMQALVNLAAPIKMPESQISISTKAEVEKIFKATPHSKDVAKREISNSRAIAKTAVNISKLADEKIDNCKPEGNPCKKLERPNQDSEGFITGIML